MVFVCGPHVGFEWRESGRRKSGTSRRSVEKFGMEGGRGLQVLGREGGREGGGEGGCNCSMRDCKNMKKVHL